MRLKLDTWIEPDRKKFRVRYRDHRGDTKHWGTYASKSEANTAEDLLIEKLKREHFGECDIHASIKDTFAKWVQAARAGLSNKKGKRIAESTIETWRNSFKGVFDSATTMGELDEKWVKDYIGRMMDLGYEEWTVHRRLVDLKSFVNWARRDKRLTWNPFENVSISQPEGTPRFYSDEELDRFEFAAEDNPIMRLWVRLGYLVGLRRKEVSQALRENIRWLPDGSGRGELTIWGYQAKSRIARTVPIPKVAMDCVGTLRQGPLVPVWKENKFLYEFELLKVKAGVKEPPNWFATKYTWAKENKDSGLTEPARYHDFRHTYCKLFLQEGGDLSRLQKITGHKDLNVLVKTYGHFETRHLHASVDAITTRRKFAGQWRGITDIIDIKSGQSGSIVSTEGTTEENSIRA